MKIATSVVLRTFALGTLLPLVSVGQALAQGEGGGGGVVAVPTLGGIGLAALAGALSIGGAWLLRKRDKE
jgi:hypothetical protein